MEMPGPTDAHRKLERLRGRWTGEEHLSPSPWDPAGGKAAGRVDNRPALDGFALIQDYEQERKGAVNFRGHGVFGYDPQKNRYTLHWFDSMGMGVTLFEGTFDGDRLVLTADQPQGRIRGTWDLAGTEVYTYRMEVAGPGEAWQAFATGTYHRSGE